MRLPNDEILEAAADWLLRIEEDVRVLTSEPFERWLHSDPRHVTAFNSIANEWGMAGLIPLPADARNASGQAKPSAWLSAILDRLRAPWVFGGVGALATMAVAFVIFLHPASGPASAPVSYATDTGEVSEFALADGSRLFLDARSSVEVRLSETERDVTLRDGRLFVDVQPDARRPFRVESDAVSFIAVGTAYAVEHSGDSWRLEVYEGTVRLEAPAANGAFEAGKGAVLTPAGLAQFDLPDTLKAGLPDWTSEQVVFDQTALVDAAAEFARYTDKPVSIVGDELRKYQVSGVFRLTDLDSFLRSVEVLTGARATETAEGTVLSASPD